MPAQKSVVPDTSARVKLPLYVPRFGKTRDGSYNEQDLKDYVRAIPLQGEFKEVGVFVIEGSIDDVWDLFFVDNAIMRWDSVKGSFEKSLKEVSDWFQPKQEQYMGKKVLAERKTLYESTFTGHLARLSGAAIFYELQKTFLLQKAQNSLIIETFSIATGFKIAEKYTVQQVIELYKPDPEVNQTVLRVSWNNEWTDGGPAFYERPVYEQVQTKYQEVAREIFGKVLPHYKDAASKLPIRPAKKTTAKTDKTTAKTDKKVKKPAKKKEVKEVNTAVAATQADDEESKMLSDAAAVA